ncbi:MAG: hypothetical protein DRJ46_01235 [Thermoprotei archaeon]|nr:MAG: hypothetical protein DRJ46_01235 [Thermoprotei archaeon]
MVWCIFRFGGDFTCSRIIGRLIKLDGIEEEYWVDVAGGRRRKCTRRWVVEKSPVFWLNKPRGGVKICVEYKGIRGLRGECFEAACVNYRRCLVLGVRRVKGIGRLSINDIMDLAFSDIEMYRGIEGGYFIALEGMKGEFILNVALEVVRWLKSMGFYSEIVGGIWAGGFEQLFKLLKRLRKEFYIGVAVGYLLTANYILPGVWFTREEDFPDLWVSVDPTINIPPKMSVEKFYADFKSTVEFIEERLKPILEETSML